jgi:hypothetical protein
MIGIDAPAGIFARQISPGIAAPDIDVALHANRDVINDLVVENKGHLKFDLTLSSRRVATDNLSSCGSNINEIKNRTGRLVRGCNCISRGDARAKK